MVTTLALAMGAALAGSISGSVAWYQYSTRATASLKGVSAGTSRNLQIANSDDAIDDKTDASWGWDINLGEKDFYPVTTKLDSDNAPEIFRSHAVRQYSNFNEAEETEYLKQDFYFQSIDGEGEREAVDVYLETLNVNYSGDEKLDEALRIAIVGGEDNLVLSKLGGDTKTQGQLDLNGDGVNDRWIFEADDSTGIHLVGEDYMEIPHQVKPAAGAELDDTYFIDEECTTHPLETNADGDTTYWQSAVIGESATKADHEKDFIIYSSGAEKYETSLWADAVTVFENEYELEKDDNGTPDDDTDDVAIEGDLKFTTLADDDDAVKLTVYVWLEGWAEVDGDVMWDNSLLGEEFSIQMRFQTLAEK